MSRRDRRFPKIKCGSKPNTWATCDHGKMSHERIQRPSIFGAPQRGRVG